MAKRWRANDQRPQCAKCWWADRCHSPTQKMFVFLCCQETVQVLPCTTYKKRKHLGELYLVTSVFFKCPFQKKHVGIGVSLYSHGWCLTKFPKTPMASSLQNDQNPYLCRWWTWSFEASQHHLGGVEWLDLRSAGCKCSKGLILPARWAGPLPVTSRGP